MGKNAFSLVGWRIQWKKKWMPFWISYGTFLLYQTYEEADMVMKQIIEGDKVRHV